MPSTTISWRSRISWHSDIVGGVFPNLRRNYRQITERLFSSLSVKFIILVGIFLALPFVFYVQFEKGDRQTRELLTSSIRDRSWLIGQALTPILERPDAMTNAGLSDLLAKFSQDGTVLRLMFRPKAANGTTGFFFVASAPLLSSQQLGPELDSLARRGILTSLANSCSWGAPVEFRYGAPEEGEELLTSVIPVESLAGCWVLISTHNGSEFLNTAIGRPYWKTKGVRLAAGIYLLFAVIAGLVALSVRKALRHFRAVTREILRGGLTGRTFASRNIVPELASVAADFDHLVHELWRTSADIRQTAEDNAHAVKTPLATIRSALEPVKRAVPSTDQRARRALQLIESSITRLTALISAAQRLGNDTADFIEAPKLSVNFSMVVFEILQSARDLADRKRVNIIHRLATDIHVLAPEGVLDVVIENVVDNAISFSKPDSAIIVTLQKRKENIDLYVEDEGPGIDQSLINYVFERYVSLRPAAPILGGEVQKTEAAHAGLGLWIVKRHINALGGEVRAENRKGGGLRIHISLPLNGT